MVLLMVLFGIDFGRVFLGWVTLTNAAREAANFAALNPTAWSPLNATVQAEYRRLITAESDGINCALPDPLPDPSFPAGVAIGSPAVVSITCQFSLITPLIGGVLGDPLAVSASASFPVRSGTIEGVPVATLLPSGSLTFPTDGPPTPTPISTPSSIPTPSQLVTPEPTCQVPNLTNPSVRTNQATQRWRDAGFSANSLLFDPSVPPHYQIRRQSLTADAFVPCSSTMTVYQTP